MTRVSFPATGCSSFELEECVFVALGVQRKKNIQKDCSQPVMGITVFALNLYFLQLFCTHSAAALDRYVLMLLTIHVFFYPSLWGKLCPQCLKDCLYLLLVGNMGKIARFQSLSVSTSHLAFFFTNSSFVIHVTILSYAAHFLLKKWNSETVCSFASHIFI